VDDIYFSGWINLFDLDKTNDDNHFDKDNLNDTFIVIGIQIHCDSWWCWNS